MRYNPKPYERKLKWYLARQMQSIEKLFSSSIRQMTRTALTLTALSTNTHEDFFFKDYPALSNAVDGILTRLSRELTRNITTGIEWSWDLSNMKNDDMVSRIVRSIGAGRVPPEALARWNQKNLPALEAFEKRRVGGMSLSDKVWAYTKGIKGDLELALDLGLGEGQSADSLSRSIRAYLNEPDRLYRRVRDEKGILRLSKSASNYHPGQGVYRSSYKNAKRLATTETNMAYRSADFERNQQLDFILGIEVHLSNNHTCLNSKGEPEPFFDICDELQGRYPKDFKFVGWHPNCRCYTTTILPTQDEFVQYLVQMDENGNSTYKFSNEVTEMPKNYTDWVERNVDRIQNAEERGKLPYFLRDNRSTWEDIVNKEDIDSDIAKALGMKKGSPMTYEEANTGKENPHYVRGTNNGYNHNCQTCTVAHELRRRGFDVDAKPNNNGSTWDILHKAKVSFYQRYETADGGKVYWDSIYDWQYEKHYKGLSQKRVLEFCSDKMQEVGRYEVTCDWRERNSGHVWLAERTADGSLIFFDPQTGEKDTFMERYLKAAELKSFEILRIDDKKIKTVMAELMSKSG